MFLMPALFKSVLNSAKSAALELKNKEIFEYAEGRDTYKYRAIK